MPRSTDLTAGDCLVSTGLLSQTAILPVGRKSCGRHCLGEWGEVSAIY